MKAELDDEKLKWEDTYEAMTARLRYEETMLRHSYLAPLSILFFLTAFLYSYHIKCSLIRCNFQEKHVRVKRHVPDLV